MITVDCWIGVAQEAGRRVVRLAGRLSDAQVPELSRACDGANQLVLDLTDLLSADAAGLEAIRKLRDAGASISGAPGYIKLKLDLAANGTSG
jgi:hypothetical protein